ncbi:MAG: HNH endonuclease [Terriglobia bacterium]|nr:HNH endonuclease [Terriglobia bacterium]
MARIRTIKPEFWTDEKIVALPFHARLLFIGLWNFADDTGALDCSPDRISMQVFPGDPDVDVSALIDLLDIAGLLEIWRAESGDRAIRIINWAKHQKIDNPSKKTVIDEGYRKLAIPSEARLAVARKYGCSPGGKCSAECYYCGMPGEIQWWNGSRGKPTKWITLSGLEFDHFKSEHSGGDSNSKNIVLACRGCNRGKREFDALQFFVERNPSVVLASPSDPYPLEGKGREGIKEGKGTKISIPSESQSSAKPPDDVRIVFDHWCLVWNHPGAHLDAKRRATILKALKGYSAVALCESISGYLNSSHHIGQNDRSTVYDGLHLLLRDADHIDSGLRMFREPPELSSKLTQHNVAVLKAFVPSELRDAPPGSTKISIDDGSSERDVHQGTLPAPH